MKKICCILILFTFFCPNIVIASDNITIDITQASIEEIQNEVAQGNINYETLMQLYLNRIEVYDDTYNTIITLNENALEEARQKDLEYQENGATSLLFGLPIIIKDNIDVIGFPTTGGTKALLDSYPYENADIVEELVEAGAIIIGKANMSELAFYASSSVSSFGATVNAYNPLYSSYGSSGGVAVSVALNFAVAGIGTDTNSSIRYPSSANNVVGYDQHSIDLVLMVLSNMIPLEIPSVLLQEPLQIIK